MAKPLYGMLSYGSSDRHNGLQERRRWRVLALAEHRMLLSNCPIQPIPLAILKIMTADRTGSVMIWIAMIYDNLVNIAFLCQLVFKQNRQNKWLRRKG